MGRTIYLFAAVSGAQLAFAQPLGQELCRTTFSDLVIPLTVWFFLTVVGGSVALTFYLWQKRAAKLRDERSTRSNAAQGGGSVLGVARVRQAWEISYRELKFLQRVGIGNVGEVFKGTFHGREVAIKRLLPMWLRDEDMVARFREEILLMAGMNHPNVLHFIGAVLDRDAGHVALVTEFCGRGTLSDVLRSSEPLPWRARLRMAWEIARGMGYLHEQARVIQRDLKTANLLVSEHLEVKISDFGLSREIAPLMETYCGTPATMAPEITKQALYDQRADIFSFGVIMWELLTRQEPYPGITGLPLAMAVATRGLRPPIPAYCPAEWAALMVRAWDTNPTMRPTFDFIQRELMRMLSALDAAQEGQGQGLEGEGEGGSMRTLMGGSRLTLGPSLGKQGGVAEEVARKKRLLARTREDKNVVLIPAKDKEKEKTGGAGGDTASGVGGGGGGGVDEYGSMALGLGLGLGRGQHNTGGTGLGGSSEGAPPTAGAGRRMSMPGSVTAAAAAMRGVFQRAPRLFSANAVGGPVAARGQGGGGLAAPSPGPGAAFTPRAEAEAEAEASEESRGSPVAHAAGGESAVPGEGSRVATSSATADSQG